MLTISLQTIRIAAPHGLYAGEALWGNEFEVDASVCLDIRSGEPWPFVDYTLINATVQDVFRETVPLLEDLVGSIHSRLRNLVPAAQKIRVAVRKLHPPMPGQVGAAEVAFEG